MHSLKIAILANILIKNIKLQLHIFCDTDTVLFYVQLSENQQSNVIAPRSNQLLRHREGIVVEDTQFSCVIY